MSEAHRGRYKKIAQMLSVMLDDTVTPDQVEQAHDLGLLGDFFRANSLPKVRRAAFRVALGENPIPPAALRVRFGAQPKWKPEGSWTYTNFDTRVVASSMRVELLNLLREEEHWISISAALDRLKASNWTPYGQQLADTMMAAYPAEWPKKANFLFPLTTYAGGNKITMPVLKMDNGKTSFMVVDTKTYRITRDCLVPCSRG